MVDVERASVVTRCPTLPDNFRVTDGREGKAFGEKEAVNLQRKVNVWKDGRGRQGRTNSYECCQLRWGAWKPRFLNKTELFQQFSSATQLLWRFGNEPYRAFAYLQRQVAFLVLKLKKRRYAAGQIGHGDRLFRGHHKAISEAKLLMLGGQETWRRERNSPTFHFRDLLTIKPTIKPLCGGRFQFWVPLNLETPHVALSHIQKIMLI